MQTKNDLVHCCLQTNRLNNRFLLGEANLQITSKTVQKNVFLLNIAEGEGFMVHLMEG